MFRLCIRIHKTLFLENAIKCKKDSELSSIFYYG
jgi:hypothetical protein